MWTWLQGTSTGPLDAVKPVTVISVFLKKPSPTQIYRCLPAPHRCGAQEQCQVNGLTYAGFSSLWTLLIEGQHGALSISHDTLSLHPKDQSCHHEVWLHQAFIDHHGDYEPRESTAASLQGKICSYQTQQRTVQNW